jgi:DNA-binding protein Fis
MARRSNRLPLGEIVKDQLDRLIAELVERGVFFQDAVSEFEKRFIRSVLDLNSGNQSQSAKALGIHRNTLGRKMDEYKMSSRNGSHRSARARRKSSKK